MYQLDSKAKCRSYFLKFNELHVQCCDLSSSIFSINGVLHSDIHVHK